MLVIGPKEAEAGAVSVRDRIEGDLGSMPFDEALHKLLEEIRLKTVRQVAVTETEPPPAPSTEEQFSY